MLHDAAFAGLLRTVTTIRVDLDYPAASSDICLAECPHVRLDRWLVGEHAERIKLTADLGASRASVLLSPSPPSVARHGVVWCGVGTTTGFWAGNAILGT